MREEIVNNCSINTINPDDRTCSEEEAVSSAPLETYEKKEEQEDVSLWKDEVIKNCRLWIENIREMPVIHEIEEEPDLYSFYEQLCVLRNEFRKNSRRSHETFSQFGEHLEEFQNVLDTMAQRLYTLDRGDEDTKTLAQQKLFLQMVELYERLRRFGEKLKHIRILPKSTTEVSRPGLLDRIGLIFTNKEVPEDSISNSIIEGFSMTLSHFEEFLAREGVSRIDVVGEFFDPSVMIAVGTIEGNDSPADTVFEEIEGGYLYKEAVLKFAKVIVIK